MDGFRILMETDKKKRKYYPKPNYNDTTKAHHPRVGFPGYGYGSNPGDRPGETQKFQPSLGDGPKVPDATTIHTNHDDYTGVIAMGNGGGGGGAGFCAPVAAVMGGGDGGGGGCGESIEAKQIDAIIESFREANPNSDVMNEINKVFHGIMEGNGFLYHSCDGMSALTPYKEVPPTSESQVSSLAASCEAALSAFKGYTGYDYLSWRQK